MRVRRGKEDPETRTILDKSNLKFASSPGPCFARALQRCPHGFLVFTREGGVARFNGQIYDFFIISILRRAASRRHSIEGARSSKCPFKLLLASLDRFPSADGMYFHVFSPCLTAVALTLSTHVEPRGCEKLYFQPMSNPAAARSSTFNPYRTQRLHGPHFREEAVFQECPLPPERALSGLSWEFAGSDRGSPPGNGMDTGSRHLPAGAAQGDPRGGPQNARLLYNGCLLYTSPSPRDS